MTDYSNSELLQNTNILFLYPVLSPSADYRKISTIGGAQKRLIQLAKWFSGQGANVILASDDKAESLVVKDLEVSGIKWLRLPFRRKNPIGMLICCLKIFSIIESHNIKIIHSHHRLTTMICFSLSKILNVDLIHNARVTFYDKKYFGLFAGRNIIAVSDGVKRNLVEVFKIKPEKIQVIFNGIFIEPSKLIEKNLVFNELDISKKQRVICIVGRISKQKGHLFLIRALPRVLGKFPNLKVLFVGGVANGEEELKLVLDRHISELGLGDNVQFLGHKERVAPYIELSEFTVLPSVNEGLPGVVIESLLLGRPVIASNIDGTNDVLEDMVNGLLVDQENPDMLAGSIIYLLSNPSIAKEMGVRGQLMARERFAVDRMLKEYTQYYYRLLRNCS